MSYPARAEGLVNSITTTENKIFLQKNVRFKGEKKFKSFFKQVDEKRVDFIPYFCPPRRHKKLFLNKSNKFIFRKSLKDDEDYTTFVSVVNKHCDDFKLSELSANNFKCLIFVQGLVSNKDEEIKRRVLNKLENEPNLTLQQIAEDCQRFVCVRQDSKDIEESGVSHIKNTQQKIKPVTN